MLRQLLWRPDVVWVVEPALLCAPTAWGVARLAGARAWLHIQDYEVDAAFDLGLLKGPWLKRAVLAGERWLMRRFDVVSTISQRMLARAQAKGVDAGRLVAFPNWVDISAITPGGHGLPRCARNDGDGEGHDGDGARNDEAVGRHGVNHFRTLLGIAPAAVVALYSGNMGAKQGLELLADAAKLCLAQAAPAQPAMVFVFCGNGAGRAELVQRCAGLPNVHFLDLQPMERLNELLALADIHLLPQRADAADLVMPSKLTGMLASARPVVATARPGTELAQVVQGCGLVVPPENPRAMADAVLALAADAVWRAQLGAAGRAHAAQHMNREAVLQRFESFLMGNNKNG